jgi:hypothetical protein
LIQACVRRIAEGQLIDAIRGDGVLVQRGLFEIGEDGDGPAGVGHTVGMTGRAMAWGQGAEGVVVLMEGEGELFEVVGALDASGGFADFLNGGQEQSNEDGGDADDHEEFKQCKARRSVKGSDFHGCSSVAKLQRLLQSTR